MAYVYSPGTISYYLLVPQGRHAVIVLGTERLRSEYRWALRLLYCKLITIVWQVERKRINK
jgi:hypothetical protein